MSKQPNPRLHCSHVAWEFEHANENGTPEVYYITELWGPGEQYRVEDIYPYGTRDMEPSHRDKVLNAFSRMVEKVR